MSETRPAFVGMRLTDPAWPGDVWVVEQANDYTIYLRRESDGRLWHHTAKSWAHAWANDYLYEAGVQR